MNKLYGYPYPGVKGGFTCRSSPARHDVGPVGFLSQTTDFDGAVAAVTRPPSLAKGS